MEFYSHEYLVHRASTLDWTQIILFVLVALLMVFALVHYFHDRRDSKKGNQSYIEVDGTYYRILKNGESGYVLERVDLIGTDIRHVEK